MKKTRRKQGGRILRMRWFQSAVYGLSELLGTKPCQATGQVPPGTEDVRDAMIHLLDGARTERSAMVALRVYRAVDAKALWFLRADLLAALSAEHGELEARKAIRRVTAMLEAMIPADWHSRPSRLGQA